MDSIFQWFLGKFTADGARLPAATSADCAELATADERLSDVGLLALVASDLGDSALQAVARRMLDRFEWDGAVLPPSLLDGTGVVHPLGNVLSGFDLALWGLGTYALKGDAEKAYLTLNTLQSVAWAEAFTSSGELVVTEHRLATAALGVILALRAGVSPPIEAFEAFWDSQRCWDRIDASGIPFRVIGTSVHDLSWAIMACRELEKTGESDNRWKKRCEDAVVLLRKAVLPEAWHPGVWNRVDADTRVSTSPKVAFVRRDFSPFPAVLASDQALLLIALKGLDNADANILRQTASLTLDSLQDPSGGVNYGQGSWFSTPIDPTVPLDRLVAPARSAGAYSVGNSSYIPSQTKHAYTQIAALWARDAVSGSRSDGNNNRGHITRFTTSLVNFDPQKDPIKRKAGVNLGVNTEAYLEWLSRTRNGSGYGLTPYLAPLGFRADTSSQTFSMLHVLSDFRVLGISLPDASWISSCLRACRNSDGGFAERSGLPSEVFTTYCAVLSGLIGRADFGDVGKTIDFIKSAQRASGGFGNAPGIVEDAWHTNLAVLSLAALGAKPSSGSAAVSFLRACQNDDGGYGQLPGRPSDAFATFRAIGALLALGIQPERSNETTTYLKLLQDSDGGFRYRHSCAVSFVGSYHAIAGLYILGESVPDVKACRAYLQVRQTLDGGFGRVPNGVSETTDEGFIAIQALHMLNGSLEKEWALMLT